MSVKQNLIERVFAQANLASQMGGDFDGVVFKNPSITVARDPGSGGRPIAKMVAKKLAFEFYDEALVEAIAKSAKRRKKVIARVDERARGAIEDTIHGLLNPEYISESAYIKHLTDVVLSIAHHGKSVTVGRGANFIIPPDQVLNVLVTAPRKVRIKRAIEYEKIDREEAIKRIEKYTKERRDFVSQYFNKSYVNPSYYDVIINTSYFDIDGASDLVISAFRKKFPTFGELVKRAIKKTSKFY